MIKFSIITVVYNARNTIERTINSVLNQNYENTEYIIIDGGSTDGTIDVIQKYIDRLTVFVSEKDNGIFDAMNKGVGYASGDVIGFINSDDWYHSDVFYRINELFRVDDFDIICGSFQNVIDGELATIEKASKPSDKIRVFFPYCHQAIFAKHDLFSKVGLFDLKYRLGADYDWILRCYLDGAKIKTTDIIIACFSKNGRSMGDFSTGLKECKAIALKHDKNFKSKHKEIINDYYDNRIAFIDALTTLENNNENKVSISDKYYWDKGCFIWGTGIWGIRAARALLMLKINILGFIDSYKSRDSVFGIDVFKPETVNKDSLVIIAAPDYYDEIRNSALIHGFASCNIVSVFELFKETRNV